VVNDAPPNGVGPGAMLKHAREARDMTQQDVSDSLNLMVRVIDDIETERWSQLPPPAFSRGYLRAYAKLLVLDPDMIVKAFDAALGQTGGGQAVRLNTMAPAKGGVAELMQKQPGTVLTGAVALVICGVVVVLWAVWPDVSGKLEAGRSGTTKPPAEISKTDVAPPAVVPSPPAATNKETSGVAQTNTTAPTERGAVEQAAKQGAEPGGPRRITETGDDRLTFAFTQDCWVDVKDRQGRTIYSELSRSGQSLELIGQAPFMIMLGYAPGVTLSFNGERVTLTPHTRNNVATLALGQ
jgi:cytoskeleton protein RodZ